MNCVEGSKKRIARQRQTSPCPLLRKEEVLENKNTSSYSRCECRESFAICVDEVEAEGGEGVGVVDFAAGDHLLQFLDGEELHRRENLLVRIRLVSRLLRLIDRADLDGCHVRAERGVVADITKLGCRNNNRLHFFLCFTLGGIRTGLAHLRKTAGQFPRLAAKRPDVEVRIVLLPDIHVRRLRTRHLLKTHTTF